MVTDERAVAARLLALAGSAGAEVVVPVRGASMAPGIPDGASVRVRTGAAAYAIGDIVLFEWRRAVVCHRIVRRARTISGRPFVVTRGDAMMLCDVPMDTAALLGRAVALASPEGSRALPPPPAGGWRGAVAELLAWVTVGLSVGSLSMTRAIGRAATALYQRA